MPDRGQLRAPKTNPSLLIAHVAAPFTPFKMSSSLAFLLVLFSHILVLWWIILYLLSISSVWATICCLAYCPCNVYSIYIKNALLSISFSKWTSEDILTIVLKISKRIKLGINLPRLNHICATLVISIADLKQGLSQRGCTKKLQMPSRS